MPPSRMSYEERKRHRAEFYAKNKNVRRPSNGSHFTFFNFEFSRKRMKAISPYAVSIFLFTLLFGGYALLSGLSSEVLTASINPNFRAYEEIMIPEDNKIYQFEITQSFGYSMVPQYSELEIEFLDEDQKHIYSVYKDLWMESHPNGNGGNSIYDDLKMNFQLEFAKKGTYTVRAISHNGNLSPVHVSAEKRTLGGGLYFGFYAIVFLSLSIIVIFGKDYWGNPLQLLEACPSVSELKANKMFMVVFCALSALFIGCIVISVMHYGYASCGEKTILPTKFLSTNNLTYLG